VAVLTRLRPSVGKDVLSFFERSPKRVWTRNEIRDVLKHQRIAWDAPESLTTTRLISFLSANGSLRRARVKPIEGSEYPPFERYFWGEPGPFAVALSLRSGSYLSHGTAVFLHGLTDQIPHTVFVNKEQSHKGAGAGTSLSQAAVTKAFAHAQRQAHYVVMHGDYRIVLLNGKNTRRLEVSQLTGPGGETLEATKLERTLIDITVRPVYAGGVFEVLKAYQTARERVSAATLVATLRKIDYAYPYHQAIGFYMERAGYGGKALDRLRSLGLNLDFYLTYQMKTPQYSREWRLFYPEGM